MKNKKHRSRVMWPPPPCEMQSAVRRSRPRPVRVLAQSDNSFPAGQSQSSHHRGGIIVTFVTEEPDWAGCHERTSPRPRVTTN